jgi:hypothetical protein
MAFARFDAVEPLALGREDHQAGARFRTLGRGLVNPFKARRGVEHPLDGRGLEVSDTIEHQEVFAGNEGDGTSMPGGFVDVGASATTASLVTTPRPSLG